MDLNWILDILTSPYMAAFKYLTSLFSLFFIGYFCWHNVYDYNDLADAITAIGANEAGILISYPLDINENLTIPSNITLRFIRGGTLNVGKYSIRNATYEWISSPSAVNEFYLRLVATGGDPGLTEPPDVLEDGLVMRKGTLGSLQEEGPSRVYGEWNFGDNDGLGYETIYVRIAGSADPDGEAEDYVEATYEVILDESTIEAGQYQIFEGPGSVTFSGTRVGNSLLRDMYPNWRGPKAGPLEAVDVRGGIKIRSRTPQAIVTFTVDEGYNSAGWVDLFNSKGINPTNFIPSNHMIADPSPWLALQAAGWEIASHSRTHPHFDDDGLTEEQLEDEIGGSKAILESWGFTVRNFCSPYGEYNDLVLKIIRKYYLGHACDVGFNVRPFNMDKVARIGGDGVGDLEELKAYVDETILLGGWMMLMLHGADAPLLTKIGLLIDYIQSKEVQILTMSEAEDLIGNLASSQHFIVGAKGEVAAKLPIVQNLLGNSKFGNWSRSEDNEGLGVVKFDTGTTAAPAVGAEVTGANGAKAKVIRMFVVVDNWGGNLSTGYVILGACGLNTNTTRFADNEVLSYAGGSIKVNYPDTIAILPVTAATIAFNDADPDTIVDSGAGFGSFANGDIVEVYGSKHNNGVYWVVTAAAGTLTLHANESLIDEIAGSTITIIRRGAGDLVRNGDFSVDVDPPRGWSPTAADLTTELAAGQVTNFMQIASSGDALGKAREDIPTVIGKIYKLSLYFKKGTSATGKFMIGIPADEDSIYDSGNLSDGAWAPYSHTFEATGVTTRITMQTNDPTTGETSLFDEISLYEITPCSTDAGGDAFDGWVKQPPLDIYREHWGTYTKKGSFYSLKLVPSDANDRIFFPREPYNLEEWYSQFQGRTVAFGAWVYASIANHARLTFLHDGLWVNSPFHSGTPGWEWLEIRMTPSSSIIDFRVFFRCALEGNIDGSTIVYVSQPMFIFGPSIGEGNYIPKQEEWVRCEKPIPLSTLNAKTGLSDIGFIDLNIEAESEGMIPKGAKALLIGASVNDDGSAGGDCYLVFRKDATLAEQLYFSPYGLVNDAIHRGEGIVTLDGEGDMDYKIVATNSDFDIPRLMIYAVQVN